MAHITDRAPVAFRLEAILAALRAARARQRAYLVTLHELEALSDRELADLGLARCDLPRIARESVERRP